MIVRGGVQRETMAILADDAALQAAAGDCQLQVEVRAGAADAFGKGNRRRMRFGALLRKLWSARNFKCSVSPHELLQEIALASRKRFALGRLSECADFLSWFLFLVVVGLYVLAVWLARGRRVHMTRNVGISLIVAGVLLLLFRSIASRFAVDSMVAKPSQDPRFDVPTIGPDTLVALRDARAALLAFEADRTLVIGREELAQEADACGIGLFGFAEGMA